MTAQEREEWIARFLEECGEEGDPEAFAARHPDAPTGLRAELERALGVASLFPAPQAPPAPEGAPSRLGRFRLLAELGRGGMSRVWRAVDPARPDEPVALKVLEPAAALDARARARFQREGEILSGLAHPGLARVRAVEEADGTPFLVLDLHEGASLADRLDRARAELPSFQQDAPRCERWALPGRPAGAASLAGFAAEIAEAVHVLHRHGIVHRDLKPGNVVLASDGAPIVVDFGLAARVDRSTLSRTGDLLGTLPYMAPEQARGRRAGPPCDVFGLGAILFEMLTLEPPRSGGDAVAVLAAARSAPVRRVRSCDPLAPPPLAAVTERALAFRPRRRFPDAAALASALRECAAGRTPRVRAPSRLERTADRLSARAGLTAFTAVALLLVMLLPWLPLSERAAPPPPDFAAERAAAARLWVATVADEVRLGERPRRDGSASAAAQEARAELVALARRVSERAPGDELAATLFALAEGRELPEATPAVARALVEGERLRQEGDAAAAVAALRRCVEAAPDDPLAEALLVVAVVQSGDEEAAARELAIGLRLLPGLEPFARALARIVEREGRERFERGDMAGAAALFEQLVALTPESEAAWRTLAITRARAGDAPGALAVAERLLAQPMAAVERDRSLRTYAIALEVEGMRDQAIEILSDVVERSPDYTAARVSLGLMLDNECRLSEARDQYEAILAREPQHAEVLLALVHLRAGSNRERCARCQAAFAGEPSLYDPDEAEALAIRFLRATGGRHPSLQLVVSRVRDAGRGAAARVVLDELIASAPDDAALGALVRARRLLPAE